MTIFGSASTVSQLTQHDLIDEYQFVVCPVLLGDGRRLLEGTSKSVKLELLEETCGRARTWPGHIDRRQCRPRGASRRPAAGNATSVTRSGAPR